MLLNKDGLLMAELIGIHHLTQLDKHKKYFYLIEYNDLLNRPEAIIEGVYKFLGIPLFKHNFKKFKQFNIQKDKVPNWKAIELQKNITNSERILKEYSNRAIKKINKKIKKIIDDRIIPELNPSKTEKLKGSFGDMPKTILDAAGSTKNKNIIKKLGHDLDSGTLSGLDEHLASNFFLRNIDDIIRYNSPIPKRDIKILSSGKVGDKNPLNILETDALKQTNESFILGYDSHRISSFAQGRQPFYVSPKKLADKLEQSSKGHDFFKLRIKEKNYLKELEESIKKNKYKPQAVRIDVYPTGNAAVFEGNHRLYRALKKGDEEICECGYMFGGVYNNSKNYVNMITTWAGQTQVEFSQQTMKESVEGMGGEW